MGTLNRTLRKRIASSSGSGPIRRFRVCLADGREAETQWTKFMNDVQAIPAHESFRCRASAEVVLRWVPTALAPTAGAESIPVGEPVRQISSRGGTRKVGLGAAKSKVGTQGA